MGVRPPHPVGNRGLGMRRYVIANTVVVTAWIQVLHWLHSEYITYAPYDLYGSGRWIWSAALASAIGLASYVTGLPETPRNRFDAIIRMLASIAFAIGAVSVAQLGLGSALLPRFVMGTAAITLLPWAVIAWNITGDRAERKASSDRVVAVVEADLGAELRTELTLSRLAEVTLAETTTSTAIAGTGSDQPLVDLARSHSATILVLDGLAQATPSVVHQAAILHEDGIRIRTLSLFYEQWLGKLPLADLERVGLMFDIQEVHHTFYARAKRLVDSLVALILLPVLGVVAAISLLINAATDRGPLLYRQLRVGKDGEPFEILKFRTMSTRTTTGDRDEWTTENDARITPLGRILRQSHLDELPQILNIFRGELSIVGPRPEQVAYVDELGEKFEFYRLRHMVRPGLTGWAQINLGYAATDSDALQKLQYDFYYLRHQGLWTDLQILARTIRMPVLLGGR